MRGQAKRDDDEGSSISVVPSTPPSHVRRTNRPREIAGRTVHPRHMSKRSLMLGAAMYPPNEDDDVNRPRTRGDCENVPRPCPYVSCRHHLYLDVSERTGGLKFNFPDLEPDELEDSCSLDVAAEDGATLERAGRAMNLTRERARQIEASGLAKFKAEAHSRLLNGDAPPKRRLPLL